MTLALHCDECDAPLSGDLSPWYSYGGGTTRREFCSYTCLEARAKRIARLHKPPPTHADVLDERVRTGWGAQMAGANPE